MLQKKGANLRQNVKAKSSPQKFGKMGILVHFASYLSPL